MRGFGGVFGFLVQTMASSASKCIFCNGSPLTNEHVFADWIKPYIPKIHVRHELHSYTETKKSGVWHPKKSNKGHRTGNPYSWKVKCVCKPCNTGWMSNDIQGRAKRFLIPLFEGAPIVLLEEAQRAVSAWATLLSIVAEFDSRAEAIAIPVKERMRFYAEKTTPPDTWKVWIGAYAGAVPPGFYWHTTLPISSPEHIPEGGDPDFPYAHTQTTTFIVGKLYAHVFSSPVPDVISKVKMGPRGDVVLSQIWPVIDRRLEWPKALMTDRDAATIPVALYNFFRSIPPPEKADNAYAANLINNQE